MDDAELLLAAEEGDLQAAIARVMYAAMEHAMGAASNPEPTANAIVLGQALGRLFPEETLRCARVQARALKRRFAPEH